MQRNEKKKEKDRKGGDFGDFGVKRMTTEWCDCLMFLVVEFESDCSDSDLQSVSNTWSILPSRDHQMVVWSIT